MMSKHYNNFCIYCTDNFKALINGCKDKFCPFYRFRFGGLEPEVEEDIHEKLTKSIGVMK